MKNYELASRDYSRAVHLDPRCSEALVNIAYIFQFQHRHKKVKLKINLITTRINLKAWEIFNAVINADPCCSQAFEGRAVINHILEDYFAALLDISRAIDIDFKNAEYYTNRGLIYQSMHDNNAAMKSYKVNLTRCCIL